MKRYLFLVFLVLFACGSPQENEDLINEQEIEKQKSYSDIAKELIDDEENSNLDTENPYIVFKSVKKSSDLVKPTIIVDAKWEKVKAIYIYFGKDCVLKKETPSLNSDSITTLEITIRKNDYKSCSEQSSALGLQIQSSDNRNLVLLPDNTLHEGTYSSLKQLNSGDLTEDEIQDILFCCHTFDFTSLDNEFNHIKSFFVLSSTTTIAPTTSTSSTTTTIAPTTSTSSTTTTIAPTTTTLPQFSEYTLPSINSVSVSASSELSVGDTVTVNYDIALGSKSLSIMYVTFLNQTTGQTYLVDKCCGIKPLDSLTFTIPDTWIAGGYSLQAVQIRDNGSDQGIVEYYNFEATGGKKQTYNKPKGAAGGAGDTHSLFTSDILFTIVSNSEFALPSIESISISSESSVNIGDLITVNYSVNVGSRPLRLMYLTFRNNSTNDTTLITNCCDIPSSGNFTFTIPDTWIAGEYSLQAVQIRDNGGSNEGIVEYYNFEATGGKKQTYNKPKGAAGGAGDTHSLFTSDILFTLDS